MKSSSPILLNGLRCPASAEGVFRLVSSTLGPELRRIPGGGEEEIGRWLASHRLFEVAGDPNPAIPAEAYVPKPDNSTVDLKFDCSGYADQVVQAYEVFRRLRDAGDIPAATRFQVALPTPVSVTTHFVRHADRARVEPAVEDVIRRELDQILKSVPAADLALQWNVTVEFFTLETGGWSAYLRDEFDPVVAKLADLGDAIPLDAELGYHLCYGNLDQRHLTQQANAARMVTFTNGILGRISRPVDWVHFPIPADREEPDYFVPLAALRRFERTQIFLGLIHPQDDVARARRRLAAAASCLPGVGVAAPCSLSHQSPEGIQALLVLHRAVAENAS